MGHGRAAELNHYPGPGNVLDLADELGLAPTQVQQVSAIEERLRSEAVPLGRQLLDEERRLEASFAKDKAAPETILTLSNAISDTEAQLRTAHLTAHVATRAVLTDAQLARYEYLQGYSDALAATEPHG
jgi:Spy/CpxP family protein refolding chaperone